MRTLYPDGTMFSYSLAESRTSLSSAFHSTVIHGLLISGAIWGTKTVVVDRPARDPITLTSWVTPARTPTRVYHLGTDLSSAPVPTFPTLVRLDLPPIQIPHGIPRIDPREILALPPCIDVCEGDRPIGVSTEAWSESAVDELPTLVSAGPLRYPATLMGIGLEGRVTLSFVIDSVGRVEPEGIMVLGATHAGFIPAAREAVAASLYEPARKGGHAVRVKVQQTVTFKR